VKVTLLGPQRSPSLRSVIRAMQLDGPVATVTAGWQEREPDDHELNQQVDGRGVNLGLYGRWLDVQERDPQFATADRRRRQLLDELQELYLLRLGHALEAAYAIGRRAGNDHLRSDALAEAVTAVRDLDITHLARLDDIDAQFYDTWPPHDRTVLAGHRAEVAETLRTASALVVAGGRVDVLSTLLHVFNVAAALQSPVIAWSAGAMAMADRVVLFHDCAPQGCGEAEVFGSGLGVIRGVVPLPHARARLRLDDPIRMSVFARRFSPAHCLLLENGSRVDSDTDGYCPPGTRLLGDDGRVTAWAAA